jgi:hypothetical protein
MAPNAEPLYPLFLFYYVRHDLLVINLCLTFSRTTGSRRPHRLPGVPTEKKLTEQRQLEGRELLEALLDRLDLPLLRPASATTSPSTSVAAR